MDENMEKVLKWLGSSDTGMSSKALAFEFMNNVEYEDADFAPVDPADLGRCLRLIDKVPEVRKCVDSLATKYKAWAKIAPVWDKIAESMRDEVGIDWSKGRSAPITYKMMRPFM